MPWDLSAAEQRVLGALVEKAATTPDQYPLSVNALRSACNQKSSREPVMALPESDVREALTALTRRGLARTASGYGGRVSRFAHRLGDGGGVRLEADEVALLCVLLLRGAQTPGELRARSERLHAFADTAAVEQVLERLADHEAGPLVRRLPREPGRREARYVHCLGAVAEAGTESAAPPGPPETAHAESAAAATSPDDLAERVAALEAAVRAIEARLGGGDATPAQDDEPPE